MGGGPRAMDASFSVTSGLCFRPLAPRSMRDVISVRGPSKTIMRFNKRATVGLARTLVGVKMPVLNASTRGMSGTRSHRLFSRVLRRYRVPHPANKAMFATRRTGRITGELKCPMLIHPSCILNKRKVRVTVGSGSVSRFVKVVGEVTRSRPVLMSGCLRKGRVRISTMYSKASVLVPNVVRRVRHTKVRSKSDVSMCPTRDLARKTGTGVTRCAEELTGSLRIVNVVGVRFVIYNRSSMCMVRMGPHSDHAMPCVDGMANVPVIPLTARIVAKGGVGSLNCAPKLRPRTSCMTIGVPMFSFRGVHKTSVDLKPRVGSAKRYLKVTGAFSRTLCGTFVKTKVGLPGRGGVVVAIHSRSRTSTMRVKEEFRGVKCRVFTADKATHTLGRTKMGTAPIHGVRRRSPGLLSLVLKRGVSLIVSVPTRNTRRSESKFMVHEGTVRANIGMLATVSATCTLVADLRGASVGGLSLVSVTGIRWSLLGRSSFGWERDWRLRWRREVY